MSLAVALPPNAASDENAASNEIDFPKFIRFTPCCVALF
jgi:hypothetical protein